MILNIVNSIMQIKLPVVLWIMLILLVIVLGVYILITLIIVCIKSIINQIKKIRKWGEDNVRRKC